MQLGADDVERARLAGDAVALAELAEHERAQAGGIAEGDDASPSSSRRSRTRRCRRGITSAIASSIVSAAWVASSAAMISESDVERNATPGSRSSACSSTALMRLPLWASASSRRLPRAVRRTGCAFSHALEPVVE